MLSMFHNNGNSNLGFVIGCKGNKESMITMLIFNRSPLLIHLYYLGSSGLPGDLHLIETGSSTGSTRLVDNSPEPLPHKTVVLGLEIDIFQQFRKELLCRLSFPV